jgi:SAM-dependent methyltransferase
LLYKDNKWFDRNGYTWDIIYNNEPINNTIYRCYPKKINNDYYYEAIDIRYDKVKPNKHNIVVNIMDLYNLEYKYEYDYIYHNTNHFNLEWKKIVECNNNILQLMLNKINTSINNILDLGCGSGRILKYLKNYNSYVGVDADMNMIAKGVTKYNIDKINFMYCDLNKEWPLILKNNSKFDTIVMINSVMHFMSNIFWEKLNTITTNSTKILLNVVEMDDNYKYTFGNDNFMERKGNKIYYKFPIHSSIKEEDYIDINLYLNKYGWNIIDIFKPDHNDDHNYDNLTKFYKWYIIIKI